MKKKNLIVAALAGAAAVVATIFVIKKKRPADVPPVNAPQVPINNPGEQTAFPGAPPTSEER